MKFSVPVRVDVTHKLVPAELCLAKCHTSPPPSVGAFDWCSEADGRHINIKQSKLESQAVCLH